MQNARCREVLMKSDVTGMRGFAKLKRKSLITAIVRAILVGLTVSVLCLGVFILLLKLKITELDLGSLVLIGIAAFLLSGVGTFFIFYRSSSSVARMLDRRFALQERVQTMLAYRDKEEAIFALQREDTEVVIDTIPRRGVRIRNLWLYILCLCLSTLVLAGAVLYTPVEPPAPPAIEEPFEITDIQIAAMEELIEYVTTSNMQSPYREDVVVALVTLLDELKLATTVNQRDESVDKAIEEILKKTDESSSAVEIIEALWATGSSTVKPLAEALNYYVWQPGTEWDEYVAALAEVRAGYIHPESIKGTTADDVMFSEILALISSDASAIPVALVKSGIASTDALYAAITAYVFTDPAATSYYAGLSELSTLMPGVPYTALQAELDTTFSALTPIFYAAIEQSSANTETGEYAVERICILFEHAFPTFKRPVLRDSSTQTGGGGDEGSGGSMGGIGTGTVYGSDDLVLDPYTDKYVEYGTILDKYYSLMFGKTEDGDYTEEEIAALKKYFEILYGGFEDQ